MRETGERCATCGGPPEDANHLTGRGTDDAQLDDDVVVPACHECHEIFHEELRLQGIDKPLKGDTVLERLERRLRRVAVFFGQLLGGGGWSWVGVLADAFVRWAEELRAEIDRLDGWNQGWRPT